jgi:hypothetical protein
MQVGSTQEFSTEVRNNGILADAADITFRYKYGMYGTETIVTPLRASTGNYYTPVTFTESGNLYYRWDTDGAFDVAKEGVVNIAGSVFA